MYKYNENTIVGVQRNGRFIEVKFCELEKGDIVLNHNTKGYKEEIIVDYAHHSEDASYDGWVMYDQWGNSWFPEDLHLVEKTAYVVTVDSRFCNALMLDAVGLSDDELRAAYDPDNEDYENCWDYQDVWHYVGTVKAASADAACAYFADKCRYDVRCLNAEELVVEEA